MAFRIEAEVGEQLGGDFDFSRYLGDMRFYLPFGYRSSLGFRFRGGYASEDAPIQKMFTLGGVGSVRAYPQNVFFGTRMLLANVEYTIASISPLDEIFDDIQLFGFADAGWVNSFDSNTLDTDDIFPAAGFGLSFADRSLRLELAWPLKDYGGQKDPTLWLRITPTF
jgi:hemolysin activation/secretion protein